jgi:hypothetical protein
VGEKKKETKQLRYPANTNTSERWRGPQHNKNLADGVTRAKYIRKKLMNI